MRVVDLESDAAHDGLLDVDLFRGVDGDEARVDLTRHALDRRL